jgi:AcrR family transcriptional regulator
MSGDRKNQIIEEAARLFSRSGFHQVTIKQLAETCGITEPALYRHFLSKEALYDAVLDSLEARLQFNDLFERLEKEAELEAILFGLAKHILALLAEHQDLYRLFLFAALSEHDKARKLDRSIRGPYITFLNGQLIRLSREGKIGQVNSEITARCFVGMVFDWALSATLWKDMQGKNYTPEELLTNNLPIFLNGLSVREAGK